MYKVLVKAISWDFKSSCPHKKSSETDGSEDFSLSFVTFSLDRRITAMFCVLAFFHKKRIAFSEGIDYRKITRSVTEWMRFCGRR